MIRSLTPSSRATTFNVGASGLADG